MPETERTLSQKVLRHPFTFFLMFVGLVYLAFQHFSPVAIAAVAIVAFGGGQLAFLKMRAAQAECKEKQSAIDDLDGRLTSVDLALKKLQTLGMKRVVEIAEMIKSKQDNTTLDLVLDAFSLHGIDRDFSVVTVEHELGQYETKAAQMQDLLDQAPQAFPTTKPSRTN